MITRKTQNISDIKSKYRCEYHLYNSPSIQTFIANNFKFKEFFLFFFYIRNKYNYIAVKNHTSELCFKTLLLSNIRKKNFWFLSKELFIKYVICILLIQFLREVKYYTVSRLSKDIPLCERKLFERKEKKMRP